MRDVIQLSLLSKLNQNTAKKRHHIHKVRVLIDDLFEDFVGLLEVLLIEELLCLNKADVERFLRAEDFNY